MYDVVIIGSGPAGLSAAVYAKRAMLCTLVIEKASYSGGQIVYTEEVDNYLGLPGINGFDMAMKFRSHAEKLGVEISENKVEKIINFDTHKKIVFADKTSVETKTIIVATGAKHKTLNVPGEEKFQGAGVSYCATCDGAFFRDKTVAVAGGGDVAIEDAIYLSNMCSKVYLIHRRDTLRGAKNLQEKLFATQNIEFVQSKIIEEIDGNEKVEKIKVKDVSTEKTSELVVDGVFVAVGMLPESSLVADLVTLDPQGYIVAGEDGVTSTAGIFAAGDVRTKGLRQIVTAVSDGANCVHSIEAYLN